MGPELDDLVCNCAILQCDEEGNHVIIEFKRKSLSYVVYSFPYLSRHRVSE
jgi:hypothetical protein